jgi:molybdenum cofactor guanylyltransferase
MQARPAISRDDITGLILAGGRGTRLGGADKGLQLLDGAPLVQHALARLAPQVGRAAISANRHLDTYRTFGVPVWRDENPRFLGPLAGILAGLAHGETEWLATVPCDAPRFPADLVQRLARSVGTASAAVAVTQHDGARRREPVFVLLRRDLRADLEEFLRAGERKVEVWLARASCVDVVFEDAGAFVNANTAEDLRTLESGSTARGPTQSST